MARDDGVWGWQWHQLAHMQTICTLLQTDNHTNTSSVSFYQRDALPDARTAVSKHQRHNSLEVHYNLTERYHKLLTWMTDCVTCTTEFINSNSHSTVLNPLMHYDYHFQPYLLMFYVLRFYTFYYLESIC